MRYLTIYDLVWLNREATKKLVPYRSLVLEEAIGYQYSYQGEAPILFRIGRFLECMVRDKPFAEGNEKTAMLGSICLMRANGYDPDFSAVSHDEWVSRVAGRAMTGPEAVVQVARDTGRGVAAADSLDEAYQEVVLHYA